MIDRACIETNDAFGVVTDGNVGSVLPDPLAPDGCPIGSQPLYRLYNNRPDANHRYTVSTAIRDAMQAQGWILKGFPRFGAYSTSVVTDIVAMCAPR